VEERQHGDNDVLLAQVQDVLQLAEVGDQVVVGGHDPPLGRPVVPLEYGRVARSACGSIRT
jgi:hypothetical protein